MSSGTKDKIKGTLNKSIGQVKEKLGGVIDNNELEASGYVQKYMGTGQQLIGVIKDKVQEAANQVGIILVRLGMRLQKKETSLDDQKKGPSA
jgi:uncharacterized protein YjbJ (UPF0337 family)